jgi:hypothetical protein
MISPHLEGKKAHISPYSLLTILIYCQVQNLLPYLEGEKKLTCRHIHYSQSLFTAGPESLAIFRGKKNSHVAIFTTCNPYLLQVQNLSSYLEGKIHSLVAVFTTHNPYLLRGQYISPYLEGKKLTFSPCSLLTILNLLPYLEGGKKSHVAIFTTHRPCLLIMYLYLCM